MPEIYSAPARSAAGLPILLVCIGFLAAIVACSHRANPLQPGPATSDGAVITGTVSDGAGSAVSEAVVELDRAPGPAAAPSLRPAASASDARPGLSPRLATTTLSDSIRLTSTDATGRFAFRDVGAGDYIVTATSGGHLAESRPVSVSAPIGGAPPETVVVVLQLRPVGRFDGVVMLDGASDHRNSIVSVQGTSVVAVTDSLGRYDLDNVPLGTWTVVASHSGYLIRSTSGALATAGEPITLAPILLPRDLNLPPTATLTAIGTCTLGSTHLVTSASDPDGTIQRYEYDFEDDGTIDASGPGLSQVDHVYSLGPHRAKVVVTDNGGAFAIAVTSFTIHDADTTYVSSQTGSPGGAGTRASPLSSVAAALALGSSPSCPHVVLVAIGYYPESISLPSNTILRGGYSAADWSHAPGAQTEIWVGGAPGTASATENTQVIDIHFTAADMSAPSSSSVAFLAVSCDASLVFEHCTFDARSGVQGLDGSPGIGAYRGGNGGSASGSSGGRGGQSSKFLGSLQGGDGGNVGSAGGEGRSSSCASGGIGGGAGTCCPETDGASGLPGANGVDGPNAPAAVDGGSFQSVTWRPATGQSGGGGCDGAGGGGGGGAPSGAGGGGGGGSAGGTGGEGGRGGGGSIGMILFNASPRFNACTWKTVDGAGGGRGGDGGPRGIGGLGGVGNGPVGARGGYGGNGGAAGGGGGGQGGPGGPSWCIALLGTSAPALNSPTYQLGNGGPGGTGGLQAGIGSAAASGPTGPSAAIGP